jgi:cobalt/nickel transport protein
MKSYIKILSLILVSLAILIPFASSSPDGLERVAENFGVEDAKPLTPGVMPDYTVPIIEHEYSSTLIAGVIGVFLVLGAGLILGKAIAKPDNK